MKKIDTRTHVVVVVLVGVAFALGFALGDRSEWKKEEVKENRAPQVRVGETASEQQKPADNVPFVYRNVLVAGDIRCYESMDYTSQIQEMCLDKNGATILTLAQGGAPERELSLAFGSQKEIIPLKQDDQTELHCAVLWIGMQNSGVTGSLECSRTAGIGDETAQYGYSFAAGIKGLSLINSCETSPAKEVGAASAKPVTTKATITCKHYTWPQ